MPDVLGPDFITLLVRDLDASYHFYHDLVGLKESSEKQPNAFAFAARPCGFAVRKASDGGDTSSSPGQGVIIWFRTDNAASLYTLLKERDVPITTELTQSPFGKIFTFRDPDGYLITVHDGG